MKHYHLLLAFWVSLLSFLMPQDVEAQGCPVITEQALSAMLFSPNTDCGVEGFVLAAYESNVAGFSKVSYALSKDNITYDASVTTSTPATPQQLNLTGWQSGDKVYLRVTGHCSGGTTQTLVRLLGTYQPAPAHTVQLDVSTTPAGGCSGTDGTVHVRLSGMSGFKRATYYLYKGTTQVSFAATNSPYVDYAFSHVAKGTYRVVAEVEPDCTPASPGAGWKGSYYEVEKSAVSVETFTLTADPLPAVGTCKGGISVNLGKTAGATSTTLEVFPTGATFPLLTTTLSAPTSSHRFSGLNPGTYRVRATLNCGEVQETTTQITATSTLTLHHQTLRAPYGTCNNGVLGASFEGTTPLSTTTFTLTPASAPPIVKTVQGGSEVRFDALSAGNYSLTAEACGETRTANFSLSTGTLGELSYTSKPTTGLCSPDGELTVALKEGVFYEEVSIELLFEGSPINVVSLPPSRRETTFRNLRAGIYTVRLTTACGETVEKEANVKSFFDTSLLFLYYGQIALLPCNTIQQTGNAYWSVRYGDSNFSTALNAVSAKAEYYKDGVLIAQKKWSDRVDLTPGTYEALVRTECGSILAHSTFTLQKASFVFKKVEVTPTSVCESQGSISLVYGGALPSGENVYSAGGLIVMELWKNGTLVKSKVVDMQGSTIFDELIEGTYEIVAYPDCAPTLKISKQVTIENKPQATYVSTSPGCGNALGRVDITLANSTQLNKFTFTVKDEAGITKFIQNNLNQSFGAQLPIGNYTLEVKETGICANNIVQTIPFTIFPQEGYISVHKIIYPDYGMNNGKVTMSTALHNSGKQSIITLEREDGTIVGSQVVLDNAPASFSNLTPGLYYAYSTSDCGTTKKVSISLLNQTEKDAPFTAKITEVRLPIGECPGGVHVSITPKRPLVGEFTLLYYSTEKQKYISKTVPTSMTEIDLDGLYFSSGSSSVGIYLRNDVHQFSINSNISWTTQPSLLEEIIPQQPGGVEGGRIQAKLNILAPNTNIRYTLEGGSIKQEKIVTGGTSAVIFEGIPKGNYQLSAKSVSEGCVAVDLSKTLEMPEENVVLHFTAKDITCPASGEVMAWLSNADHVQKVSYTINGETTSTTSPSTPTRVSNTLAPGTYTLTAKVDALLDGSVPNITQSTSFKIGGSYSGLNASNSEYYNFPSSTCVPTGKIQLSISAGTNLYDDIVVKCTEKPSTAPASLLTQQWDYNTATYSNKGIGGSLPPGKYKFSVSDGCTVRPVEATIKDWTEIWIYDPSFNYYKTVDCKDSVYIRTSLSGNSDNSRLAQQHFEYAILPPTAPLSSGTWKNWSDGIYTKVDFDLSDAGFRYVVRDKYCHTAIFDKTYPAIAKERPSFTSPRAHECKYYLSIPRMCAPFRYVITKDGSSVFDQIVPAGVRRPDYVDDTGHDYVITAYDANNTYASSSSFGRKEIFPLKLEVLVKAAVCNGEKVYLHIIGNNIECPTLYDFKVRKQGQTAVLHESNRPSMKWAYPDVLEYGTTYEIEVLSAGGTSLGTWTYTPASITYPTDFDWEQNRMGISCSYSPHTLSEFRAIFPSTSSIKKIPPIKKVTITFPNYSSSSTYVAEAINPTIEYNDRVRITRWKITQTNTDGTSYSSNYDSNNWDINDYKEKFYRIEDECGHVWTGHTPAGGRKSVNLHPKFTVVKYHCNNTYDLKVEATADITDIYGTPVIPLTIDDFRYNYNATYPLGTVLTGLPYRYSESFSFKIRDNHGETCSYDYSYYAKKPNLAVDAASTNAFFCQQSGKGDISIKVKDGVAPYTYTLKRLDGSTVKSGTQNNDEFFFQEGAVGETYVVDIADACGNQVIHSATIASTASLEQTLRQEINVCAGNSVTLNSLPLPNATFTWKAPNGTTLGTGQTQTITPTPTTAGVYTVEVKTNTCGSTIVGRKTVNVIELQENTTTQTANVCAGHNVTFNIGAPAVARKNNVAFTPQYQWLVTTTPSNSFSWKVIPGAQQEVLNYTPMEAGTYYLMRRSTIGNCTAASAHSTLTVEAGPSQYVAPDATDITIKGKKPFILTAGLVSAVGLSISYQWERSLDGVTWTPIVGATSATYRETTRYGRVVYYRRESKAGHCSLYSPTLTVRFKGISAAYINPHLRLRDKQ